VTLSEISVVQDYNISDFLRTTDKDIKELSNQLKSYQDLIKDPDIALLVREFLSKYGKEYVKWPAAKRNHHHFLGGLLEHVVEMLDIAKALLGHYPEANSDLVYAGIILHDCGKIRELEVDGFTIDYGLEGNLIGHITLGVQMLDEIIFGNDASKFKNLVSSGKWTLLKHILLAHHGKLEFGSPTVPKTIEAGIVSRIDVLSSDTRNFKRVVEESRQIEGEGGQFSAAEFTLDGARVFLGTGTILPNKRDQEQLL
jgi:3'-5' exoribonuclease